MINCNLNLEAIVSLSTRQSSSLPTLMWSPLKPSPCTNFIIDNLCAVPITVIQCLSGRGRNFAKCFYSEHRGNNGQGYDANYLDIKISFLIKLWQSRVLVWFRSPHWTFDSHLERLDRNFHLHRTEIYRPFEQFWAILDVRNASWGILTLLPRSAHNHKKIAWQICNNLFSSHLFT